MKRILLCLGLVLNALCSGCVDVASRTMPDVNALSAFDGHWQIDRQASDDVRGRLLPIFERNETRWRRRTERFEEPPPGGEGGPLANDEGISNMRWLQHERQKEIQDLIALVSPASQLDFSHNAQTVRIATDKGEGTRTLILGETSSLFLSVGGFSVAPSWDKGAFIVDSRGTSENRIRIVERFTVKGDRLVEQLEIKTPNTGKQMFHLVYKR